MEIPWDWKILTKKVNDFNIVIENPDLDWDWEYMSDIIPNPNPQLSSEIKKKEIKIQSIQNFTIENFTKVARKILELEEIE